MRPEQPGALVISLDFELHWGVRDSRRLAEYKGNLLGVRQAVPAMLDLFARYRIHATWATVGFLFCQTRDELLAAAPPLRPGYEHEALCPYRALDAIGADEEEDPFHYAPSLINRIRQDPCQEIGTHTFSHYYSLERGQTEEAFEADLRAGIAIARRYGVETRSLVFPRNQINPAYLPVCERLGIVAYRGNPPGWLYEAEASGQRSTAKRLLRLADTCLPISGDGCCRPDRATPCNVPASRFLRPYTRALAPLDRARLHRISSGLAAAADGGRIYHLWWHPHNFGACLPENLRFLESLLQRFGALRDRHGMESLTMLECATRRGATRSGPG